MKSIETYLPIFPGFYSTIFEADEDQYLEENDLTFDQIVCDYPEYHKDVAKSCCNTINSRLDKYVTDIVMQNVSSPKEYNFHNDSINIEVKLDVNNIERIRECIYDNREDFDTFLADRYTSRSGFISSHSNSMVDWRDLTADFTDYSANAHYLGSMLEFVCQIEDIDQDTLHDDCEVRADEYCTPLEQVI